MTTPNSADKTRIDPLQALIWHADMGIDEIVLDQPQNRFELAANQKPSTSKPEASPAAEPTPVAVKPAAPSAPSVPASEIAAEAQRLASEADTLEKLYGAIEGFDGCSLKHTAMKTVRGTGNPNADIMIIGRCPGKEDDREGLAFQGTAGELLGKMTAAIGLDRNEDLFATTLLPWRPPGNRTPNDMEIAICLPFIMRQIEIVAPNILILMGGMASKAILKAPEAINRLRGKWREIDVHNAKIAVMPTYHPEYLLQHPRAKKQAWHDLLEIKAKINQ